MFGIDWNGDGKETLFDDIMTADVLFGMDEEENEKRLRFDDEGEDDF